MRHIDRYIVAIEKILNVVKIEAYMILKMKLMHGYLATLILTPFFVIEEGALYTSNFNIGFCVQFS